MAFYILEDYYQVAFSPLMLKPFWNTVPKIGHSALAVV